MSSENTQKAWKRWSETRSPGDLSGLLDSVSDMIEKTSKASPGVSPRLAKVKARNAAIKAAQTYDPEAGASFRTHLFNHLKPLTIRGHTALQGVSISRGEDEAKGRFREFVDNFMHENHREPSIDEIIDGTGLSKKRASRMLAQGMNFEIPEGMLEEGTLPGFDNQDDPEIDLWLEYVYLDLPDQHKNVVDYRLGRNGRPALKVEEIARRTKMSPAMVSRITDSVSKRVLGGIQETKRLRSKTEHSPDQTIEDYEQPEPGIDQGVQGYSEGPPGGAGPAPQRGRGEAADLMVSPSGS